VANISGSSGLSFKKISLKKMYLNLLWQAWLLITDSHNLIIMVSKNTSKIQVAESRFSDRHMVSAGHHLAADAAREILDAGGNAADAGVCGGICLAVLLSEYVNFAGVAPIIYRHHETGEVFTISGLGWWPKKASLEVIRRDYGGKIPLGILRTVIPGAPDAWITALERFGTMSFGEVADAFWNTW
jgi:gamma-glutamyltranspeptidase